MKATWFAARVFPTPSPRDDGHSRCGALLTYAGAQPWLLGWPPATMQVRERPICGIALERSIQGQDISSPGSPGRLGNRGSLRARPPARVDTASASYRPGTAVATRSALASSETPPPPDGDCGCRSSSRSALAPCAAGERSDHAGSRSSQLTNTIPCSGTEPTTMYPVLTHSLEPPAAAPGVPMFQSSRA